ncbi:MAG: tricorn protease [Frankiaceae bacterium]|nr:tricorn protease [Frankiaceae bacterium]
MISQSRVPTMAVICMAVWVGSFTLAPLSSAKSAGNTRQPVFAAVIHDANADHLVVGRLGGAATRIFTAGSGDWLRDIAVSPVGNQVAFIDTLSNDEGQLAVINTDGSGVRVLTHAAHAWYEHPVWSADGHTVFYSLVYTPADPTRSNYPRVWRVPADASAPPTRIQGGSYASPDSARPSGRWLALSSAKPDSGYGRCAIMRIAGTHRRNVGPDNCSDPIWRPGTSLLAISRVVHDSYSAGPTVQIWMLSVKTSHYHPVSHTQSASTAGQAFPLAWSKDGSHLYFEHTNGQHLHVYRIRPDGTGKVDVTPAIPQQRTTAIAVQPAFR